MKIRATIILFTIFFQVKGNNIDSLNKVLSNLATKKNSYSVDTQKVNILCAIAKENINLKNNKHFVYLKQALDISEKSKYLKGKLNVNLLLAKYYESQNLKTIEYLLKALAIAENLGSDEDVRTITSMMGGNYMMIGDYDNSIKYFEVCKNLCQKLGKKEDYLLAKNNIGTIYFLKAQYDKALLLYNECENENNILKSDNIRVAILINKAHLFIKTKDFDSALLNLRKALKIKSQFNDQTSYAANQISEIYSLKGDYPKALEYSILAYQKRNSSLLTLTYTTKSLAEAYKKLSFPDSAYKYLELHLAAKQREDSIKNANLQRLGNLDYTNEKQLQEIDKLTETVEIQERKYVIAAGLATVLFVILGIIGYLIYSIKKKNLEIDSQKKAIEELKIKEALVEGQTIERKRVAAELHDNIGSTISGLKYQLQALNLKNENSSVKEIFTRLVDMIDSAYNNIRKLSHNLMPEELEQNGLIGALQKLIDNLNVSDDVFFKLKVHGQIPPISREVTLELYGCCLETINNITRHANATKVFIDVSFLDGQLIIEVKDNGKGFSVTKQRLGNGLKNLESRIQKIKGKISISSEIEVGTKISFEAEPIVQI